MTRTPTRVAAAAALFFLCISLAAAQQSTRPGSRGTIQGQRIDAIPGGPHGFSVVLVLGDMAAASTQDNVPPAARKALLDMKDFLPFKSYRLLDVQWTLCCGRSPVVSRLRGVDEQEYDLELAPSVGGDGKLYVRFLLKDPGLAESFAGSNPAPAELATLVQQQRALEAKLADLRARYNENHPDVIKARNDVQELQRQRALRQQAELGRRGLAQTGRNRTIIDTSFTMDVGETVVVGTSRVKGADKALIALLTAAPARSTATKEPTETRR